MLSSEAAAELDSKQEEEVGGGRIQVHVGTTEPHTVWQVPTTNIVVT